MSIDVPVPPSRTRLLAEAAGRAVLSAIPWVGGIGVELVDALATRGRQARFDSFLAELAEGLNGLIADRGRAWKELAEDDGFIDAIGVATASAVGTANRVKIEALRAAVLNST